MCNSSFICSLKAKSPAYSHFPVTFWPCLKISMSLAKRGLRHTLEMGRGEMLVRTSNSLQNCGGSLRDGLQGQMHPSSACDMVHNSYFSLVRQRLSLIFSYFDSWLNQGQKQSALSLNSQNSSLSLLLLAPDVHSLGQLHSASNSRSKCVVVAVNLLYIFEDSRLITLFTLGLCWLMPPSDFTLTSSQLSWLEDRSFASNYCTLILKALFSRCSLAFQTWRE